MGKRVVMVWFYWLKTSMKTTLLVIFFLVTIVDCYGQDEIGIGIVSISFDDKTVIKFFESSDLENEIQKIEFFNDESINSWNIKNLKTKMKWLQPESLWLDYGQFIFRCKTQTKHCYEVYVSDSKTMWIRKELFTDFLTWEEYLKGMFRVERIDSDNQNIYSRPFTNSLIIKSEKDCFQVKSMSGYWIEVFTVDYCDEEDNINKKIISGWIRWRDENKILINYYTTS